MKKKIQLRIDSPCHEKWDAMIPSERGRFCALCQKEVIDFTSMNDQQVLERISRMGFGICGRLAKDQLNRELVVARPPRPAWLRYAAGILLPAALLTNRSMAQKVGKISHPAVQYPSSQRNNNPAKSDSIPPPADPQIREISGRVIDEQGYPVIGASVFLSGMHTGTATDTHGRFSIKLPSGNLLSLEITSVGHEKKIVPISPLSANTIEILLPYYASTGLTTVIVGEVSTARKRIPVLEKLKDSVSGKFKSDSMRVYPNPISFGQSLTVDFEVKAAGSYTIQVFTISGQPVFQKDVEAVSKKYVEKLDGDFVHHAGSYVVKIINKTTGKQYSREIIVL